VPAVAGQACGPDETWHGFTRPMPPNAAALLSSQYARAVFARVNQPATLLNTEASRADMLNAMRFGPVPLDVRDVATHVAAWLGMQPVPQRARRKLPNGTVDVSATGYLGSLLDWGESNRTAFHRILFGLFNQFGPDLDTANTNNRAHNCTEQELVPRLAKSYRDAHDITDECRRYLCKPSTPSAEDMFLWDVPRYDVATLAQLVGNGVSASRLRVMQRAWALKELADTDVDFVLYVYHHAVAFRDAFAGLPPEQTLAVRTLFVARNNALLAYLVGQGVDEAAGWARAPLSDRYNPIQLACEVDIFWRNTDGWANVLQDLDAVAFGQATNARELFRQATRQPPMPLDTAENRTRFVAAMATAHTNIEVVAQQVPAWIGLQPVAQKARKRTPVKAVDVSDTGYVSELLRWASVNRQAFSRVLMGLFSTRIPDMRTAMDGIISQNCRDRVNILDRVQGRDAAHPVAATFRRYMVNTPVPVPTALFTYILPKYNADELVDTDGNGISATRTRSMQSAWARKLLHSVMRLSVLRLAALFQDAEAAVQEAIEAVRDQLATWEAVDHPLHANPIARKLCSYLH